MRDPHDGAVKRQEAANRFWIESEMTLDWLHSFIKDFSSISWCVILTAAQLEGRRLQIDSESSRK